jgi:hypothetical protein
MKANKTLIPRLILLGAAAACVAVLTGCGLFGFLDTVEI